VKRNRRIVFGAGIFVVVALLAYMLIIRPWHLTWGATAGEVSRAMPGDELVPNPSFNATRAVTIEAGPEDIWPWLLQMGYLRAGFYSYDKLDNKGIPSAERILPELQDLKVGDKIPVADGAFVKVVSMRPSQSMVWQFETGAWGNSTWAWGLYRKDENHTRLITRLRIKYNWLSPSIFGMLIVDVVELVMMRKCLLGIKRRVETAGSSPGHVTRHPSWYDPPET
jgi:hypothetical protein